MKRLLPSLLLLPLLFACEGKAPAKQYFKETGDRFHTVYHITYQHDSLLTAEIDSVFTAFNDVLNVFDPNSLASKFNRNETNELHPMLEEVVAQALIVSEATGGVYDITGAPLFDIWGFGTKGGASKLATQEQVDSILQFVGYQKLILNSEEKRLEKSDPRVIINPSSLSKGYITDLIARELERHGVEHYLVEIGGEVVAKGVNPDGKCWRIGVNRPVEEEQPNQYGPMYVLPLCEKLGLASSGDYRNYKIVEGKKVAHTIAPTTGYPAHQDILGATVVAPTCMEADAWATAFMALGLERSIEVLEGQPQLEVCLIYADPQSGELSAYIKGLDGMKRKDEDGK